MADSIRVLTAEDEGLFRDLVKTVLSQQEGIELVGAFPTAEAALEAAPGLKPDVALLDIELGEGGMNGVQLGVRLRRVLPKIGIVLLSNHNDARLLQALPPESMGGWSYLIKKSVSNAAVILRAIRGAADGLVVLDPALTSRRVVDEKGPLAELTPRQRDILELIAEGYTNAAIADQLGLTVKSVENQINGLYQTLYIDREDRYVQPRVNAVLIYLDSTKEKPLPTR